MDSAAPEALQEDDSRAHEVEVEKYRVLAAERGGGTRAATAILRGLRRHVQAADTELLEQALWTYELMPLGPSEVAGTDVAGAALLPISQVAAPPCRPH